MKEKGTGRKVRGNGKKGRNGIVSEDKVDGEKRIWCNEMKLEGQNLFDSVVCMQSR